MSTPKPSGKTVFLAEDDPAIARMYQIKLSGGGFKVVVCGSGQDAYEQIMALKPDLVLLDLNLPERSGFEIVKALQNQPGSPPPNRIVVLTNSSNPAGRQQAAALGMDYLIKAETTPGSILNYVRAKLGFAT